MRNAYERPVVTRSFLRARLAELGRGGRYSISPDLFAELFPPDHEDDAAYSAAAGFARKQGCVIDYWQATNEVFFTR